MHNYEAHDAVTQTIAFLYENQLIATVNMPF